MNPGYYRLDEDIVFNPNVVHFDEPYNSDQVEGSQFDNPYSRAAFGIGFFAAIAIFGNNITLDLNGHSIDQSKEHALQQRFYSNIELGSAPFIPNQGPHDFGQTFTIAKNVCVKNGHLGRSSHHSIHGNLGQEVLLENITMDDHEVAAVHMNSFKDSVAVNCDSLRHRTDVPILGIFSSARFLRTYIDALYDAEMGLDPQNRFITIQGVDLNIDQVRDDLRIAMNITYQGIVDGEEWWKHDNDINLVNVPLNFYPHTTDGPTINRTFKLFHNPSGVIDGNSYGFALNGRGVAVNGFPTTQPDEPSENIQLINCTVKNLHAEIREVPSLHSGLILDNENPYGNVISVNDPVGAIFQTQNRFDETGEWLTIDSLSNLGGGDSVYLGNAVSNAQLIVAKYGNDAALDNLSTTRMTLDQQFILDWASTIDQTLDEAYGGEVIFVCNGDSMFHVNKGVVAFKLDGVKNVLVKDCLMENVSNTGSLGSLLYGDYETSHPNSSLKGYNGADIRGISISSSDNVRLENLVMGGIILSECGNSIGVDCMFESENIHFNDFCMKDGSVLSASNSKILSDFYDNPTGFPHANLFKVDSNTKNVVIARIKLDGTLECLLEENESIYNIKCPQQVKILQ